MERNELAALIPHTGRMCLLDRVLRWDAVEIRCSSASHWAPTNPLRADDRLHAVCALEYAAQAAALHAALTARADGIAAPRTPGYLAGIRRLDLGRSRLDDLPDALIIDATRLFADRSGLVYEFAVSAAGHSVASGSLSILLRHTAQAQGEAP